MVAGGAETHPSTYPSLVVGAAIFCGDCRWSLFRNQNIPVASGSRAFRGRFPHLQNSFPIFRRDRRCVCERYGIAPRLHRWSTASLSIRTQLYRLWTKLVFRTSKRLLHRVEMYVSRTRYFTLFRRFQMSYAAPNLLLCGGHMDLWRLATISTDCVRPLTASTDRNT